MNLLFLLLTLLSARARPLPATMEPAEIVPWRAADGWTGELRRYPGPGRPLVLVHGMGANHYNWDYRPEVSLAAWLQARGWDVWVPSLRGDPGTQAPSSKARRSFTFDDFATLDLPAALDVIAARTGEPTVTWVGHSMGGMLLYAALNTYPERVRAGVAIASPVRFDEVPPLQAMFSRGERLIGQRGLIPTPLLLDLTAPLGRANPVWPRLAEMDNMHWPTAEGLAQAGMVALPRALATQAALWIRADDLTRADGRSWLGQTGHDAPVLVLSGGDDWIAPPDNVDAACARLTRCSARRMAPEGGFARSYGHIDAVLGATVREDIYPVISSWLAEVAPP